MISGSLGFGEGETFDNKGEMLKPGAFLANPARHAHYAWTGNDEAILQVQFVGPGGIDYINPADDPRKNELVVWRGHKVPKLRIVCHRHRTELLV